MKDSQFQLPTISVLVATYNRADYLRICLACLCDQDYSGKWQIVVADDGSNDHTLDVISEAQRNPNAPKIIHCWHEHKLFRKAVILNEASRFANGELLFFLDSDCLPALNVLSVYAEHAAPDSFYLGGVYKLNQSFSKKTLGTMKRHEPIELLMEAAQHKNQNPKQGKGVFVRYWKSKLYIALKVRRPKIWGANFAVNRDVFEKINGFDENFVGWGQEDSDLRNRLVKGAYEAVALHTKSRVYHLWHPTDMEARSRPSGELNNRRYYIRPDIEVVCRKGLRKL
ncbi:MAG: glycosyltransferase [Desulfobacteraceae bacterium]|nr:MAG: glycosyltransferase [Desulfobacteraceae bacterium]